MARLQERDHPGSARAASAVAISLLAVFSLTGAAACSVLRAEAAPDSRDDTAAAVSQFSGWTRDVLSPDYLVVVNVLPAEEMFTHDQQMTNHPTEGELIIDGAGRPTGEHVRHVEAHLYRRDTGEVVTDVVPTITVINRTTGEVIDVEPTLMQDVNIGELDRHYGNNVMVMPNSDIRVVVDVDGQEVSVDGHLD